ncbi:MAG: class I SAM-dependent methyltransferase, partial [Acidimicrobiia bacterium]
MDPNAPGYAGFKDYSPTFLRIYDWWVLGVMAKRVWKTPVPPMVDAYSRRVGRRHLDVGPGTGYLLDAADLPDDVEITLLDPNPHVLAHTAERLAGHDVVTVEANVLEPLPVDGPFDSAALSNVLHCLPGPMDTKGTAIGHVADVLGPDGVLFGSTVLGLDADHTRSARAFLTMVNRQGGFDNAGDTV